MTKKERNKEIQKERAKKRGKIFIDQEDPFASMHKKKIIPIKINKDKK